MAKMDKKVHEDARLIAEFLYNKKFEETHNFSKTKYHSSLDSITDSVRKCRLKLLDMPDTAVCRAVLFRIDAACENLNIFDLHPALVAAIEYINENKS